MALVFAPGKICGVMLSLFVEVQEQDYDKTWNHLLLSKPTPAVACGGEDGKTSLVVSGEVHLSLSGVDKPLPFKEGETFRAFVKADCYAGGGIDESITDRWAAYRVWTCDVTFIETRGYQWQESTRSSSSPKDQASPQ